VEEACRQPCAGENPLTLKGRPYREGMEGKRKFLGILFECCRVYRRIYLNREKNAYEGNCPRCGARVKVAIGPEGSDSRFFRAK